MWQEILVAVAVVAAGAWVLWSLLLPRAVTDRLRRMAGRRLPEPADGCAGCSGCGGQRASPRCGR